MFFARNTDPFPHGSLNEPVTVLRTIATDKTVDPICHTSIFPRGCVAYVTTDLPWRDESGQVALRQFHSFLLDQDTGGGIRAAGHCDIYMGIDNQGRAADLAGRTVEDGRLYYIFLKPGAIPTPAPPGPAAPPTPTGTPASPAAGN